MVTYNPFVKAPVPLSLAQEPVAEVPLSPLSRTQLTRIAKKFGASRAAGETVPTDASGPVRMTAVQNMSRATTGADLAEVVEIPNDWYSQII